VAIRLVAVEIVIRTKTGPINTWPVRQKFGLAASEDLILVDVAGELPRRGARTSLWRRVMGYVRRVRSFSNGLIRCQ
jgi:hypothetical protein